MLQVPERFRQVIFETNLQPVAKSIWKDNTSPLETGPGVDSRTTSDQHMSVAALVSGASTPLFVAEQLRQLKLKETDAVLDVGCGEPRLVNLMSASHLFPTYVGIDGRLKPLFAYGSPKHLLLVHGNALISSCFKPASFRVVVCTEVLEHLTDADSTQMLKRIGSWLQPGGFLLGTVPLKPPNVEPDMEKHLQRWHHLNYDTWTSLTKKFRSAGLRKVKHWFTASTLWRIPVARIRSSVELNYPELLASFDTICNLYGREFARLVYGWVLGEDTGWVQFIRRKETSPNHA